MRYSSGPPLPEIKRSQSRKPAALISIRDDEKLAVRRSQEAPPEAVPAPTQKEHALIAVIEQLVPLGFERIEGGLISDHAGRRPGARYYQRVVDHFDINHFYFT